MSTTLPTILPTAPRPTARRPSRPRACAVRRGRAGGAPHRHRLRHRRRRLRPRGRAPACSTAKGRGREMPPPVLVSAADHARRAGRRRPRLRPRPGRGVLARARSPWSAASSRRCSGTSATPAAPSRCGCPTTRSPWRCWSAPARWRSARANLHRRPAAADADAAEEMLGESVAVIVDAGRRRARRPRRSSTCTGDQGRVLRRGALCLDELNAVLEPLGRRRSRTRAEP